MDIFFFIGTVSFTLTGYLLGVRKRFDWLGVAMLGFISAVGGGMIRDMLVNDIPFILHRDFYGAVSILVALGWHALNQLGWQRPETEYALFALGLALRLWAHRQALRLPAPDASGH